MPERWTRAILRHRVVVLVLWGAVLAGGILASGRLPPLLTNSFAVPGTDSDRAAKLLAAGFGERPEGSFVVVFRVRHPSDSALRSRLQGRLDAAAREVPTARARALQRGGGILYGEIATRLDLKHAKRYTDVLRRSLGGGGGPMGIVTGQPAIQHDLDPVLRSDLHRAEAIALPAALLVLLAMFGLSLAVAIPFVFAACSIACTLIAVYAAAHVLETTTYVTNLVTLIGLGLAIDYSLLIVSRFREEIRGGAGRDDAAVRTMATAGRTIVFSGTAVAVGLGLLLLVPIPFVRSMGAGGLFVPLGSIAAALTLQPVLLTLLGAHRAGPRPARPPVGPGVWEWLARAVIRHRWPVLAGTVAAMAVLAVPAFWLHLVPGSFAAIPAAPQSGQGLALLRSGAGPGVLTPTHVVIDTGTAQGALRPDVRRAVTRLADRLFRDPEVLVVASGKRPPYVDGTGRYTRVIVVGRHEYGAAQSQSLVRRLRRQLIPAAAFPAGATVATGGAAPQGVDFLATTYGAFPLLVLAVLAATYLTLVRAFRSLLLPLEAVLLNLLTVAAVYGLLVLVFQWGIGADLLGVAHTSRVEGWIPIFLFATLFGLSMDYEVFIVTRVREAWDRIPDNGAAVAAGLERTGRIVTAAALIMVATFSGFVAGRVPGLQQLGLGLALAVLLDATIVRMLLVPALLAIVGRWNWWLPDRVARLVRVEPSPLPGKT